MKRLFFVPAIALAILTLGLDFGFALNKNDHGKTKQTTSQQVRVQIQVIADSSNTLQAALEVPAGTAARDLMDRLFKMSYVDFTHKFVSGIAGFVASSTERKYWRLEIDGKDSEVGIAEIKISKAMRMRWVMTEIK
jgi:hypothetical protein